MSEMIQRVAEKICDDLSCDATCEARPGLCERIARAAIAATREPDEAVIDAGCQIEFRCPGHQHAVEMDAETVAGNGRRDAAMNEMFERIVRAAYDASPMIDGGEAIDGFQVTPAGPLTWEQFNEADAGLADEMRERIRAAIAAMFDPAEAMLAAIPDPAS